MYLSWNEQIITDFSDAHINTLYREGYLFTRVDRGVMKQTRSVRIDLSQFELSSENRRILKKTEWIEIKKETLPYANYSWKIGKLAKDFYETKFGKKTFSANKIKELLTTNKSNFNRVFVYSYNGEPIGYCIARETNEMIHYSYPFYTLNSQPRHGNDDAGGSFCERTRQKIYLSWQCPASDRYLQTAIRGVGVV